MTSERTTGPTLHGGDYTIAVYVLLDSLEEVDEAAADGIVVTEYTRDGRFVFETVAALTPSVVSVPASR